MHRHPGRVAQLECPPARVRCPVRAHPRISPWMYVNKWNNNSLSLSTFSLSSGQKHCVGAERAGTWLDLKLPSPKEMVVTWAMEGSLTCCGSRLAIGTPSPFTGFHASPVSVKPEETTDYSLSFSRLKGEQRPGYTSRSWWGIAPHPQDGINNRQQL